ncbi:unnamed protein product [Ranitomeya imitator]|uniref:Adipocyte plasma membrane-associated protein n=1 Tax=Ranitomeya imitator TaxID=111125 RepID=A0ABN9L4I9_9NEOB|nr:unnamed protein product [Ranitomeya imitator]
MPDTRISPETHHQCQTPERLSPGDSTQLQIPSPETHHCQTPGSARRLSANARHQDQPRDSPLMPDTGSVRRLTTNARHQDQPRDSPPMPDTRISPETHHQCQTLGSAQRLTTNARHQDQPRDSPPMPDTRISPETLRQCQTPGSAQRLNREDDACALGVSAVLYGQLMTMEEGDGLRQRRPIRPQVITDDTVTQETRNPSSYSGKVFRATFTFLALSLLMPFLAALCLLESPIEPQSLSAASDDRCTGAKCETEKSHVLFTGTNDGQILKIEDDTIHTIARLGKPPCGTRDNEPNCGRPLGIRVGPNGTLFVADAYQGIFEVNPTTGAVVQLVSSATPIQGKKMSFLNDLAVTSDGRKIYFTDSSSKWQRRDYPYLVMEATDDGRLVSRCWNMTH